MINAVAFRTYQPRTAFRGNDDSLITVFTPDPRKFMLEYLKKDIKNHPELKDSPVLKAQLDHSNLKEPAYNYVLLQSRNNEDKSKDVDFYKSLKETVDSCVANNKLEITGIED